MAPAKLKYTFKITKRTGTQLWYFRHPTLDKPARIPGLPGTPVFHREYTRLLSEAEKEAVAAAQRVDERSVRTLVEAYKLSDEWTELRADTQRNYTRELDRLLRLGGDLPFAAMTKRGVLALRKTVKAEVVEAAKAKIAARIARDEALRASGKPVPTKRGMPRETTGARTADMFKAVISALYSWAIDNDYLPEDSVNPAGTVKKLQSKKNVQARTPWTEDQISLVLASAPQPVKDGIVLGLHTGQRLEDVIAAQLWQVTGSMYQVTQSKTGNPIVVPITGPMTALVARRRADKGKHLLVQEGGKAYTKRLFSEHLREHLDELGLHHLSFHGLRYAAAGRLQEAGCTIATISDIIGHSTYQMAMKYLAARERMGRIVEVMDANAA